MPLRGHCVLDPTAQLRRRLAGRAGAAHRERQDQVPGVVLRVPL